MLADPTLATKPSLTLKRRINATPAKIFRAWTDPKAMTRWFGPNGASEVETQTDPQVGGRFRASFRTPNGEYHQVGGVYREIVPDARLVFTWAWHTTPERESIVTVDLKPDGEATLLTLTHEQFFDEAARDGHRGGWTGTLAKLEALYA